MKRIQRNSEDKALLKLIRDYYFYREQTFYGFYWVDISPPILKGYKRFLVPIDKNDKTLKQLANYISPVQYCNDRRFLLDSNEKNFFYTESFYKDSKKNGVKNPLSFKSIYEYQYNSLQEDLKQFFYKTEETHYGITRNKYAPNVSLNLFRETIKPVYLHRRKVLCGDAESKYKELENKLYRDYTITKYCKAASRSFKRYSNHDWEDIRVKLCKKYIDNDIKESLLTYFDN